MIFFLQSRKTVLLLQRNSLPQVRSFNYTEGVREWALRPPGNHQRKQKGAKTHRKEL
jgi:hypothetical protein